MVPSILDERGTIPILPASYCLLATCLRRAESLYSSSQQAKDRQHLFSLAQKGGPQWCCRESITLELPRSQSRHVISHFSEGEGKERRWFPLVFFLKFILLFLLRLYLVTSFPHSLSFLQILPYILSWSLSNSWLLYAYVDMNIHVYSWLYLLSLYNVTCLCVFRLTL